MKFPNREFEFTLIEHQNSKNEPTKKLIPLDSLRTFFIKDREVWTEFYIEPQPIEKARILDPDLKWLILQNLNYQLWKQWNNLQTIIANIKRVPKDITIIDQTSNEYLKYVENPNYEIQIEEQLEVSNLIKNNPKYSYDIFMLKPKIIDKFFKDLKAIWKENGSNQNWQLAEIFA